MTNLSNHLATYCISLCYYDMNSFVIMRYQAVHGFDCWVIVGNTFTHRGTPAANGY